MPHSGSSHTPFAGATNEDGEVTPLGVEGPSHRGHMSNILHIGHLHDHL